MQINFKEFNWTAFLLILRRLKTVFPDYIFFSRPQNKTQLYPLKTHFIYTWVSVCWWVVLSLTTMSLGRDVVWELWLLAAMFAWESNTHSEAFFSRHFLALCFCRSYFSELWLIMWTVRCVFQLEVQAPPGTPIGYVMQGWHPYLPKFTIWDERKRTVLRIVGPFCDCNCCSDVIFKVLCAECKLQSYFQRLSIPAVYCTAPLL